jgi:hypothetical protein
MAGYRVNLYVLTHRTIILGSPLPFAETPKTKKKMFQNSFNNNGVQLPEDGDRSKICRRKLIVNYRICRLVHCLLVKEFLNHTIYVVSYISTNEHK